MPAVSRSEMSERVDQRLALLGPDPRDDARLVLGGERFRAIEGFVAVGRELERMGAPVGARRQAPGEAAPFELVEQSHHPRPLDAEGLGNVGLPLAMRIVEEGWRAGGCATPGVA